MNIRFTEEIKALDSLGLVEYHEDYPLSAISTFKIGGNCAMLVYPKNINALKGVISLAKEEQIPFAVFGRCSNVLFSDKGYSGVIICTTKMKSISRKGREITAECGVLLSDISRFCMKSSLAGFEFGFGIPGTVGGAVYMNAGAYEHSVSEILKECSYYSVSTGEVCTLTNEELDFSYRHSIFTNDSDKIIIEATFNLENGNEQEIKAQMDDYMSRRRSKQPLEYPSAGSVFKRCEGHFTGKLIEDLGLKGFTVGGAMVSERHAGFIINYENATADDVKKLVLIICDKVKEKYGLELVREVIYFGEE